MFSGWRKWFPSSSAGVLRRIGDLDAGLRTRSDSELKAAIPAFRERLDKGEPVFELLPEVFAVAREASSRVLSMRHFDVQIQGGVELAMGRVVEMATGEGKTLVATLPAVLHALSGRGVHVVTVNDYLARRDAEWMGALYRFLGLSVGCVQEDMGGDFEEENRRRRAAYAADITYGTNSEMVFDFLRDNLADEPDERVHRELHFAIVDEVDLLLVDEAQTPLIISGAGDDDLGSIKRTDRILRGMREGVDFRADFRTRTASFTEKGLSEMESRLACGSLSDPKNLLWMHAAHQSLQAHAVYERDVDYIVEDGEVHIVDEHTGRVSPDKRFSDGLHQALEAKENLRIQSEDVTLAKTSYQYYFRGYRGLCGMTGTAWSEREEFRKIYNRKTVRIPTNRPMIRKDYQRLVFRTSAEKHAAILGEIEEARDAGRPVLVGSVSVKESETLSRLLKKKGIRHNVLNAKEHGREAEIIAQAGRRGAVTISTNMAGRGTDILLGGNPSMLAAAKISPDAERYPAVLEEARAQCEEERREVVSAGGLYVLGTGEHESVRIDNQLRGRAGRQGDPGSSVYFVSLDDPVYRKFGQKQVLEQLRERLADHSEGEPVEDRAVWKALDELRKKVEVENQAIRLDVFKYDSVIHERREAVWKWRRQLLGLLEPVLWRTRVEELLDDLLNRLEEDVRALAALSDSKESVKTPDVWNAVVNRIRPAEEGATILDRETARRFLLDLYDGNRAHAPEGFERWERRRLLEVLDKLWTEYLTDLDRVEEGIGLQGYAQLDPLVEFKKEAARMYGRFVMDLERRVFAEWLAVDFGETEDPPLGRPEKPGGKRGGAPSPRKRRAVDRLPEVRRGGGSRHRKKRS